MNLFIDECIAKKTTRVAADFMKLAKPPVNMQHFFDLFTPNERNDEVWARQLTQNNDPWIVITADKGTRSKKGAPLQLILPAYQVTGYFLSAKIAQGCGFEKLRAIISVLGQIRANQQEHPPGTRFKINRFEHSFKVVIWPLKINEQEWVNKYQ